MSSFPGRYPLNLLVESTPAHGGEICRHTSCLSLAEAVRFLQGNNSGKWEVTCLGYCHATDIHPWSEATKGEKVDHCLWFQGMTAWQYTAEGHVTGRGCSHSGGLRSSKARTMGQGRACSTTLSDLLLPAKSYLPKPSKEKQFNRR